MEGVALHPKLHLLDLSGNQLGLDGAQTLAELLRTSPTLETVRLAGVGFGAAGVGAVLEAVRWSGSVRSLDVAANRVGVLVHWDKKTVENFEAAAQSFVTLTELSLARNGLENEAALRFCENLRKSWSIESLDLSMNGIAIDAPMDTDRRRHRS